MDRRFIFLEERFTPLQLAGAVVTLAAVSLINSNQGKEPSKQS